MLRGPGIAPQGRGPRGRRRSTTLESMNSLGAVLLIGAPGTGKTTLGTDLEKKGTGVVFLNVGGELRRLGLVDEYFASSSPDVAKLKEMKRTARSILAEGIRSCPCKKTLVLEFVKDQDDAHTLLEILEDHNVQLRAVFFLNEQGFRLRRPLDAEQRRRMPKWNAVAPALIELFSSLPDVLFEEVRCVGVSTDKRISSSACSLPLASMGYARADSASSQRAETKTSPALPFSLPSGWVCVELTWVVSPRLVTNRALRSAALSEARTCTGLASLANGGQKLPVPSSSVATPSDAEWVAWPGRYKVSRKCDGTRHLLFSMPSGTFFSNRAGNVYAYPLECALPVGTVLDGELVWVGGKGFFLAFDALAVQGRRVWQLPLARRLQAMEHDLALCEAEASDSLRTAHARSAGPPEKVRVHKKQQAPAPGSDGVLVLRKMHVDVTASALDLLAGEDLLKGCPYPADGLVFTPCGMPYALGMQRLLFKWQPQHLVGVDLKGTELLCRYHIEWSDGSCPSSQELCRELVYECMQVEQAFTASHKTTIVSVRFDKTHGNRPTSLKRLKKARSNPLSIEEMMGHISKVQESAAKKAAESGDANATDTGMSVHPARVLPFCDVYAVAMRCVEEGTVLRTVHEESGLEVFNYSASAQRGEAEGMFRGLVLHPGSGSVVATPFVRFYDERKVHLNSLSQTAAGGALTCASEKVDGSLIVAFVWGGEVCTATRRRMDSEQALWAKEWIKQNVSTGALEEGWTYLFEAVYADNAVVVEYDFEGLVLLSAVSPLGIEIAPPCVTQLAERLGVLAVPFVYGRLADLAERLHTSAAVRPGTNDVTCSSSDDHDDEDDEDEDDWVASLLGGGDEDDERPPCSCSEEGWVLAVPGLSMHGDGCATTRVKLVCDAYKRASCAGQALHPLAVWDAVRTNGAARDDPTMPRHMQAERMRMLDALEAGYEAVWGALRAHAKVDEEHMPGEDAVLQKAMASLTVGSSTTFAPSSKPAAVTDEALFLQVCQSAQSVKRSAAVPKLDQHTPSMYYTRGTKDGLQLIAPRTVILDCIRPWPQGDLFGYSPSANFKQVWAKGWVLGPSTGRLAAPCPLLHDILNESALSTVLEILSGQAMIDACLTCSLWESVVTSLPSYGRKLSEYRSEVRERADSRLKKDAARPFSNQVYRGYGSDFEVDSDYDSWDDEHW